jgi:hypothetical protein
MAHDVLLWGGPWHGQLVAVQDDRDHFHILVPFQVGEHELPNGLLIPETIHTREGMYSCVKKSRIDGTHEDYEWDGWTSHD